jgi:hypothetical protein
MIKPRLLAATLAAAGICGGEAWAVHLDGDGVGQVLIYPYYTVQNSGTDGWNTYLSVVNRGKAKAVRVRFREGRNGREVASFNVFLSAGDVWTGGVFPVDGTDASGAKLLTADVSCADPAFTSLAFSSASYSGASSDGLGTGLDRTREGYVEMIEMAALTGASAAAVTHNAAGTPASCAMVRAPAGPLVGDVVAPSGDLSGTLTLINVNSGMDMGVNAVALADLTAAPFYRNYDDPYPDFSAAEVRPESFISANGASYYLKWRRGVDAVSSVLMATRVINEYVLDTSTASQTDWVMTFPTRRFYAAGEAPFVPFRGDQGGQNATFVQNNRDGKGSGAGGTCGFGPYFCTPPLQFTTASVAGISRDYSPRSRVLGSFNFTPYNVVSTFTSGFAFFLFSATDYYNNPTPGPSEFFLDSLPDSTGSNHLTGATLTRSFRVSGLPVTGLMVRTFKNGTLTCAGSSCQGNYGGVFPHRYLRTIDPRP